MNGIGGRTIAEAQEVLSYTEFRIWLAYRQKRGTLNLGMRVERGSALLATLYANAHRGKDVEPFKLYDFAPHHEEPPVTIEQAMERWV